MNLDTSRILNTDEKVLANALIELAKSENTIDASQKYRELYRNQPLSFIISNSERIFAEPRQGLEFYREIIDYFPLYTLCDELTKITNYVHDHKDVMHPMLAKDYERVIQKLRSRISQTNCFGTIEDVIIKKDPENRARIMALCEFLRKAGDDNQNSADESPIYAKMDKDHIDAFNSLNKLTVALDPVISLIYIAVSPKANMLRLCARNISKSLESGGFVKTMESAIYLNMMGSNTMFQEAVRSINSMDARCVLNGLAETDVISEFTEYANSELTDELMWATEVTLDNFIEAAMADLQEDRTLGLEDAEVRAQVMDTKLQLYESVLDIVTAIYERCDSDSIMEEFPLFTAIKESYGLSGDITVEDGLKVIVEATSVVESELDEFMTEYTIDGRPGSIISRHSAGTKYNEDITKGVNARPKSVAPTKSGAVNDDDDENSEIIPDASRLSGSRGMPDSSDPNAKRPVKPKHGIIDKVTTKAMDADAAGKQKTSKIKAAGQAVTNVGKAVLKVPSGVLAGLGNMVKSIDGMDDNRRKEYMIRPGFRKKIFKNIRVAAMYGATAYVNKLYLPIAWFARKMSKEKNKRIRNEFVAELETEIKVTEAKIEDANSKGDQEQRYQLIRIKDKLTRDLQRVKYNSKYL